MGTLQLQPDMLRKLFCAISGGKKSAIFRDFCSLAYHLVRLSHNDLRSTRKHFTCACLKIAKIALLWETSNRDGRA